MSARDSVQMLLSEGCCPIMQVFVKTVCGPMKSRIYMLTVIYLISYSAPVKEEGQNWGKLKLGE